MLDLHFDLPPSYSTFVHNNVPPSYSTFIHKYFPHFLTVDLKTSDEWWYGHLSDGKQGYFPPAYVALADAAGAGGDSSAAMADGATDWQDDEYFGAYSKIGGRSVHNQARSVCKART